MRGRGIRASNSRGDQRVGRASALQRFSLLHSRGGHVDVLLSSTKRNEITPAKLNKHFRETKATKIKIRVFWNQLKGHLPFAKRIKPVVEMLAFIVFQGMPFASFLGSFLSTRPANGDRLLSVAPKHAHPGVVFWHAGREPRQTDCSVVSVNDAFFFF